MTQIVACCPYCSSVIGIEVMTGAIVFLPEECLWAELDFDRVRVDRTQRYQRKQSAQKQSAHWIWEYRRGLRRKDKRETHVDQRLAMYVFGLGIRNVPCEFIPKAEHEIVGNSAMYREKARKGTGEFKIQCEGGPWNVTFDGFAIFSPVPKQVMEQIRRHLKVAPVDDFV
jgi:hypothetical protein